MKKIICFLVALATICKYLSASSFSDLANNINTLLDDSSSVTVSASLQEGRDILPSLYKFTSEELVSEDKKVIGSDASFIDINVIDNIYTLFYSISFKFGLFPQRQDSILIIKQEGDNLCVTTPSMVNYSIDRKGKRTTNEISMSKTSCTQNSQNILNTLLTFLNEMTEEEYKSYYDKALYNLDTFSSVNEYSKNTIKAKNWHEEHPVDNKIFTVPSFIVSEIDISDKEGFKYVVKGNYIINAQDLYDMKGTYIIYYTNDQEVVNLEKDDVVTVDGIVEKFCFDDLLFTKGPYFIEGLYLLDNKE